MTSPDHHLSVAHRKLWMTWRLPLLHVVNAELRICKWEALDDGSSCVTLGWRTPTGWEGPFKTCVVTEAELVQERADYEARTSLCRQCGGSGQQVASVSVVHGVSYKDCTRCRGKGDATIVEGP